MKSWILTHTFGQYEFYAENKVLATDHAKYLCQTYGWKFVSVKMVRT